MNAMGITAWFRISNAASLTAFFFTLVACAPGTAHENFERTNQIEIGKSSRDPAAHRNRYREDLISSKNLSNGNLEEAFRSGRRLRCKTYFEIDTKAEKIVGWRYEGSEEDCAIVP
jgi:hypothetical protein